MTLHCNDQVTEHDSWTDGHILLYLRIIFYEYNLMTMYDKNNCQGWESVGLAGVRRDAAPVVSREPGHVTVAVTGPGRTWHL